MSNHPNLKTYTVCVTDYVTDTAATYVIRAEDGDTAYAEACRRIDPTGKHTIGGSFHRADDDWGLR